MTLALSRASTEPILEALSLISEALDGVATTNPVFMEVEDKVRALTKVASLEARLTELKLRILADADDVAGQTGARDIASWEAFRLHTRVEDARDDQALDVCPGPAVRRPRRGDARWARLPDGDLRFHRRT